MKHSFSRIAVATMLSIGAISLAQAHVETYHAHGTVQQIDVAQNKVTLAQNSVSELGWPQRTMTYKVDGNDILKGISKGQTVDATFTADSPYQATVHFVTPVSH